jgi:hypothetical protein
MKRDMELIRKVLLAVQDGRHNLPIESYSDDEIKYHRALAIEKKLVDGRIMKDNSKFSDVPAEVNVIKLTWAGHDFIDAITSDSDWQKVKDFLKDAGKQITLDTVKVAVAQLFRYGTA